MKFLKTIFLFLLLVSITGNVEAKTFVKRLNMVEMDVLIDHLNNTLAEKIPAHIQRRYGALNLEEGRLSNPESNIVAAGLVLVGAFYAAVALTGYASMGVIASLSTGKSAAQIDPVQNFYFNRVEYHFELESEMSGSCLVYFGYDFLQKSLEYELDQCVLNKGIIVDEAIPQKEEGRVRIGIEGADVFDRVQGQTQVVATGSIPLDLEN